MTVDRAERRLRLWNAAALIMVVLLAALPRRWLPASPPESAADILGNGIVVGIVVGFWLRMLIECATAKALRYKPLWLLSFLLLPIFSAFIYFATTRSIRAQLRTEDSTTPPRS